jgi:hypothetical protein
VYGSVLHEIWIPLVMFWGTLVLACVFFKRFRTALPDFNPNVWVLSLIGMVIGEFAVATQVLRVAYLGHLIVPTLVILVAALCTAFAGKNARLGYIVPLLLAVLWIPDLKKMHELQAPTMRNLFEAINQDQAATGKKAVVVLSHEWYGPAAYRYLDKNIPFVCFPDFESPVAYLDWIGYSSRIRDDSRMVKVLQILDDKLKNGYCVYHMYLDIHRGKNQTMFARVNFARALQVHSFLVDHARQEKIWDSHCYQVPGVLDSLKTHRFCR